MIGTVQGADLTSIAIRSRPALHKATSGMSENKQRITRRRREEPGDPFGWRASVWDEVSSTAEGALRRTIKILITDGPQPESEENM